MEAEFPAKHYLNDGYGISSWLLTRDHKRIALLYLVAVTFFFFVGGAFAVLIRLDLATPAGDLVSDDTYNQLFTMHGVVMVFFFLIPAIPAILGNFPRAADDRREGSGVSEAQPAELVHLHCRRTHGRVCPAHGRARHRLDDVRAVEHEVRDDAGRARGARHFRHRLLFDPDGPQLHRHDSPHAGARHDVVQDAAFPVGDLRDEPHQHSRHAGDRHHRPPDRGGAAFQLRLLRSGPRRGSGAVPAPLLVLFAPGCLHHGAAGNGRHQRAGGCVLPEARIRIYLRRVFEPRHRRAWLPRVGSPHVRCRPVGICVARVLAARVSSLRSLRP